MRHAWKRGSFTVAEILHDLTLEDDVLAFSTLSTLVERIREKGYLTRSAEREGYSFVYSVRIGRDDALRVRVNTFIQELVLDDPQLAVLRDELGKRAT